MAQYINKDAVVAAIKKIYNEDYKFLASDLVESVQDFKDDLLIALDTLEVKDVDIKNAIAFTILYCQARGTDPAVTTEEVFEEYTRLS